MAGVQRQRLPPCVALNALLKARRPAMPTAQPGFVQGLACMGLQMPLSRVWSLMPLCTSPQPFYPKPATCLTALARQRADLRQGQKWVSSEWRRRSTSRRTSTNTTTLATSVSKHARLAATPCDPIHLSAGLVRRRFLAHRGHAFGV